jgi:hypothetical protein
MTNVIPLHGGKPGPVETTVAERKLIERFGIDERLLRDAIRPLFLLMHDHGVSNVSIERKVTQALITVDGKRI